MPKINSEADITLGLVVWFKPVGEIMTPPKGVLDKYAQEKAHPYVCTYIDSGTGATQWLFLTSDALRANIGCKFEDKDKDGTQLAWRGTTSHFLKNNCVEIPTVSDLIKLSSDDSFTGTAFVKRQVIEAFGEDVRIQRKETKEKEKEEEGKKKEKEKEKDK